MVIVPVRPEMLIWVRNHREHSLEDAAEGLGMSQERLTEYESGGRQVSKTMFRKFARYYKLPEATFTRRTPPPVRTRPSDFRTIDGRPAFLSFATLVAIDRSRGYLTEIARIMRAVPSISLPVPPQYSADGDAAAIANEERSRLGIRIEEQFRWRDAIDAFRSWRAVIESSGIPVFAEHFPLDDCRGFSLYDSESIPSVTINWDEKVTGARIFSLIHEYAHILTRNPGISDSSFADSNATEAFCNRFAAEFLMPIEGFERFLGGIPTRPRDWSDAQVRELSQKFHVSSQAMALRLQQIELAPGGFYERFIRDRPDHEIAPSQVVEKENGGFHYAILLMYRLGFRFTATVLDAFDQGGITMAGAANVLKISPTHFEYMKKRLTPYRAGHGGQ